MNTNKRALATLSLMATISLAFLMSIVPSRARADNVSSFHLGIGGITAGNHVFFGNLNAAYDGTKYAGSEKSTFYWRVLDTQSDNTGAGDAMLLLSENLVGNKDSKGKQKGVQYCSKKNKKFVTYNLYNLWHDTDVPAWCDSFYNNVFSPGEREAIRGVSKREDTYKLGNYDVLWQLYDPNTGHSDPQWKSVGIYTKADEIRDQRVFFLSYDEVKRYLGTGSAAIGYMNGSKAWWWLRSPVDNTGHGDGFTPSLSGVNVTAYAHKGPNRSDKGPGVDFDSVTRSNYVRPAMSLKKPAILFSNAVDAKSFVGPVGKDGLRKVVDFQNLSNWELTIEDPAQRSFDAALVLPQDDPKTMTFNVSGVKTGKNRFISAIVTDGNSDRIAYYGHIADCTTSAPSTIQISLPENYDPNRDRLYVFSELYEGGAKTSYASPLNYIDTKERCTVTFDLNGHGSPQPQPQYPVRGADVVHKPTEKLTEPGYMFVDGDWYTEPECTHKYDFGSVVTKSFTLYARWQPLTYYVYFEPNGTDGVMNRQKRSYDDEIALPACEFVKDGSAFTGWNTEPDGTGDYFAEESTLNVMVPEDGDYVNTYARLYAQWTDEYTVTFDTQGHGLPPEPAKANVANEWKVSAPTAPVVDGYTFDGWFADPDCDPESAWDFATTPVPCDMTLYAKWVANPYTIAFAPGKGSGSMKNQARTVGDEEPLPACTFAAPAYDTGALFTGWNTQADGSGDAYGDRSTFDVATEGSVTLYAQWSPTCIVTFDLNGRGAPRPAPQMRGVQHEWLAKEPSPAPSATGYTFGGWFKEPACENEWIFSQDTLYAQFTRLYADWIPHSYWVNYDPNGGEGNMPATYRTFDDGRSLAKNTFVNKPDPEDLSLERIFCGWNTQADGSGRAFGDEDTQNVTDEDGVTVTLFAQWDNAQITTNELPDGLLGEAYELQLEQTGLVDPVWRVAPEELPDGLHMSEGGVISGVPTQAGTYTITVKVEGSTVYGPDMIGLAKTLALTVRQEDPEPEVFMFTEGMNGIWTKGGSTGLAFKTNGYFPLFASLQVDGEVLAQAEQYTAEPGSTSITLLPAYLETLREGSHVITACYDDGQEPFTQFTVASAPEPEPDPEPAPKPEPEPKPDSDPKPKPEADPESHPSSNGGTTPASASKREPLPDTSEHTFWLFLPFWH